MEIIVIVGPTGVGKTKISIELAKKLNAEIINGDSVSIYKELNIGSAKPTLEEQSNIPHHLLNIKTVTEDYNVYEYQKDARKVIEELKKKNKNIILVGGTGLYIKSVLYDYQFAEEKEKKDYSNYTKEELIEKINQYITEYDKTNKRRLERLLQKLENQEEITYNKDKLLYPCKIIGLTVDRNILYNRINERVEIMFQNGLLKEVEELKEKYKDSRVLNSGIGYKEFVEYFNKEKNIEEVKEQIKLDSRRFAKRQYTFFNHQFDTKWYEVNLENINETIEKILKDIKG